MNVQEWFKEYEKICTCDNDCSKCINPTSYSKAELLDKAAELFKQDEEHKNMIKFKVGLHLNNISLVADEYTHDKIDVHMKRIEELLLKL